MRFALGKQTRTISKDRECFPLEGFHSNGVFQLRFQLEDRTELILSGNMDEFQKLKEMIDSVPKTVKG